jgi:hypothetical protein
LSQTRVCWRFWRKQADGSTFGFWGSARFKFPQKAVCSFFHRLAITRVVISQALDSDHAAIGEEGIQLSLATGRLV